MGSVTVGSRSVHPQVAQAQTRTEVEQKLDALWSENRAMVLQRLDMLERECWRWLRSPQDKTAALIVRDLAHKMAGLLGTFGMKRGSSIATTLERLAQMQPGARGTGASIVYALLTELRSVVQAGRP